ncbi:MAG: protein kinase, partial [Acidobacteria bacterium]|nr:protein kinase [Acidobacteriota bacterium]
MLPSRIGRYVIVDHLGRGGMGVVYRAWDPDLRRNVALKTVAAPLDIAPPAEQSARFLREARAVASLSHPNIVTIHDIGYDEGRPFIAMELLEGESLAELIRRKPPLSTAEKLRLARDMCRGLAYAHRYGVVHRDIKPANIMIASDGTLKLLDFGLAQIMGEHTLAHLTREGAILGTLNYLSPEQLSGAPGNERSDIFAAGAVLFELFTYRRAFEAEPPGVMFDIVNTSPPPLRQVEPAAPEAVEGVVRRMLEKDPQQRYERLEDVLAALDSAPAALATPARARADTTTPVAIPVAPPVSTPLAAPAPGAMPQVRKARQGSRRVAIWTTAVLVLTVAVLLTLAWLRPAPADERANEDALAVSAPAADATEAAEGSGATEAADSGASGVTTEPDTTAPEANQPLDTAEPGAPTVAPPEPPPTAFPSASPGRVARSGASAAG